MNKAALWTLIAWGVGITAAQAQEEEPPPGGVIFVEQEEVPPVEDPGAETLAPPPQAPAQPAGYGVQPAAAPVAVPAAQTPRRRYRETYDPNREYPEGAQIVTRRRYGLLIPGAVLFALSYGMTASVWANLNQTRDPGDKPHGVILVPVLGPFIGITGADDRANPELVRAGLIWDGLLQTAGLAMLIVGLLPKHIVTYYADTSQPGYAVTPRLGGGNAGLDLHVRF